MKEFRLSEVLADIMVDYDKTVEAIIESDVAEELINILTQYVDLFEEDTFRDVIDVLDNNDIVCVTIGRFCDGEISLFVESLIKDDGRQFTSEACLYLIQDEISEYVQMDKLLEGDKVVVSKDEDCEEDEDGTEELLDDITEELIESLLENDDECVHCKIKGVLREVYEIAYQDAIIDMED